MRWRSLASFLLSIDAGGIGGVRLSLGLIVEEAEQLIRPQSHVVPLTLGPERVLH